MSGFGEGDQTAWRPTLAPSRRLSARPTGSAFPPLQTSKLSHHPRNVYGIAIPSGLSKPMRIFGLAGWSGAGKTTLLRRLIPDLIARGMRVSTVKHAHHGFDIDQPGKDSWEHRQAGATEVLVASGRRWALMHELREAAEPGLALLLARLDPVDLVLVEGFKREAHPKLEVHRPSLGKPLLHLDDPAIGAVAADAAVQDARVPVLDLNDVAAIATHVLHHAAPLQREPDGGR